MDNPDTVFNGIVDLQRELDHTAIQIKELPAALVVQRLENSRLLLDGLINATRSQMPRREGEDLRPRLIQTGDRFRRPGAKRKNIRPTRVYTVLERRAALYAWYCEVDPPLADGSSATLVMDAALLRCERLPRKESTDGSARKG